MNFEYFQCEMDTRGDTLHPSLRIRVYDDDHRYFTSYHYGNPYSLVLKTKDYENELEYFITNIRAFRYACDVLASAWATSIDQRVYRACQLMDKKLDDIEDNI